MEEKNTKKVSLSSCLLIIAIIAIIAMGIYIYKLNKDKIAEIQKSTELQSQVNSLNGTVSNLQGKIDSISNTINSNNDTNKEENEKNQTSSNISKNQNNIKYDEEISISDLKDLNSENLEKYYEQYNGKILKITGYVTDIGETEIFLSSVGLSDNDKNLKKTYVSGGTNDTSLAKILNSLKKGEKISIIGWLSVDKSIPLSLDIMNVINE